MADYLTLQIAAEEPYGVPVRAGGGVLDAPERSGEAARMFDNTLLSSENPAQEKRVWKFTTAPLSPSEWNVLRAKLAARELNAGGYAIRRDGGTVLVWATLDTVPHEADGVRDVQYVVTFTLQQI